MKKTFGSLINSLLIVIIVLVGFVTIGSFVNIFSFKFFIVSSGSMQPTIKTGSLILSQKTKDVKKNDIITFFYPLNEVKYVTHRVINVENVNKNEVVYRTKGDANNTVDSGFVRPEAVYGRVLFAIPWLGYFFSFVRTTPGLTLFFIIPTTIIVYSELLNIIKEIKLIVADRNNKKSGGKPKKKND